jgi:hypothetical protein
MSSPIDSCEAETKLIGDYVSDNLDAGIARRLKGI